MRDERDKELLVAFCEWSWGHGGPGFTEADVAAFLATRRPPDPLCTRCGHPKSDHSGLHNGYCCAPSCECVAWPDESAPQRFWRLHEQDVGFGVNSNYQAMECDEYGVRIRDLGPMRYGRVFRERAEADGVASGLPEWTP